MVALLCVLQQLFRLKSKSNWHGLRCNANSIHWFCHRLFQTNVYYQYSIGAVQMLFFIHFLSIFSRFVSRIELQYVTLMILHAKRSLQTLFQHKNINLLHCEPHIIIRCGIDVHHIWRIKNWTDKFLNDISQHANINELPTFEIEDTHIKILILDVRNSFLMSIATADIHCREWKLQRLHKYHSTFSILFFCWRCVNSNFFLLKAGCRSPIPYIWRTTAFILLSNSYDPPLRFLFKHFMFFLFLYKWHSLWFQFPVVMFSIQLQSLEIFYNIKDRKFLLKIDCTR